MKSSKSPAPSDTTFNYSQHFDLKKVRQHPSRTSPAVHQQTALSALHQWYEAAVGQVESTSQISKSTSKTSSKNTSSAKRVTSQDVAPQGGIVVLPTGGGKTFTATRFLCRGPLSQGYKVLWLAHTHHLLEQAYRAFVPQNGQKGYEVGSIIEPREHLQIRVVSGTSTHFPVHTVEGEDDVVIATLQTLYWGIENLNQLSGLKAFLKDAKKLVVVFDEAHHAPAPSFRSLIETLRRSHPQMLLLGLTATPVYSDEDRQGWLKKLFPQGILHQVSAKKLMADGVLARPVFENYQTEVTPEFDEREYQKWLGTYRDLPPSVIEHLARNYDRNLLIAQTYIDKRQRYGKTLIFAERWYQCEQIRELLMQRGVKAGAVYSHVESAALTAAGRNRRDRNANAKELQAFRDGELDVLINVQMLTEGTDVPDVQTVFLTRQTTSHILLTQMVGRALRGPKFGGTPEAFIVTFQDRWQQAINWATYELSEGGTSEERTQRVVRPPLQLISIDLVRRLARQLDGGRPAPASFTSLLPLGWYQATFDSQRESSDEIETAREFVMVFENDQPAFGAFLQFLQEQKWDRAPLTAFGQEDVTLADVASLVREWRERFFGAAQIGDTVRASEELERSLLDLARHVAQSGGSLPAFFAFEERVSHDLDAVVKGHIEQNVGIFAAFQSLEAEFNRPDRYWRTLYPTFTDFKAQYDALVMGAFTQTAPSPRTLGRVLPPPPDREPSEDIKRQVKARDGYQCLCCGETNRRVLQIDHIASFYVGGSNDPANLQTLCKTCNGLKSINDLNFRASKNAALVVAPSTFTWLPLPDLSEVKEAEAWRQFIRRSVNMFYRAAAVHEVRIGGRGTGFYEWEIELCSGNDPQWLKPHLKAWLKHLQEHISLGRRDGRVVERLIVKAPNCKPLASPIKSQR